MSETESGVKLSIEGSIATITLNIPEKHNSLDGDNIQRLCDHLDAVEQDSSLRVLIVTGSGNKTFCAGASLDQMGSGSIFSNRFAEMADKLAAVGLPTICAFNGSAYGGGSEIGLACDFRMGVKGMRLFVPPARIGLCYPVNGLQRFVSTLGLATTKRLMLASEEFFDEELLRIGYLTHLVDRAELKGRVQELAQRMASYAPLAIKAMKQIIQQAAVGQLDKQRANKMAQQCNNSLDLQEGLLAHREKRQPVFKGEKSMGFLTTCER